MTLKPETMEKLRNHIGKELDFYRAIDQRFRKKYRLSLKELEEKIEKKGVSLDKHDLWEDSIEWWNAKEEIEKAEKLLKELA